MWLLDFWLRLICSIFIIGVHKFNSHFYVKFGKCLKVYHVKAPKSLIRIVRDNLLNIRMNFL